MLVSISSPFFFFTPDVLLADFTSVIYPLEYSLEKVSSLYVADILNSSSDKSLSSTILFCLLSSLLSFWEFSYKTPEIKPFP